MLVENSQNSKTDKKKNRGVINSVTFVVYVLHSSYKCLCLW